MNPITTTYMMRWLLVTNASPRSRVEQPNTAVRNIKGCVVRVKKHTLADCTQSGMTQNGIKVCQGPRAFVQLLGHLGNDRSYQDQIARGSKCMHLIGHSLEYWLVISHSGRSESNVQGSADTFVGLACYENHGYQWKRSVTMRRPFAAVTAF